MASLITSRGPVTPTMNITPLIDVVFLLIIFFMLVNNITSDESVEMVLPTLTPPHTRDLGEVSRVVVNVAPQSFTKKGRDGFPLDHAGHARFVKVGTGPHSQFVVEDIEGITGALTALRANNPDIQVLLRADAALYYDEVRPVMGAITAAGIGTVNLVAYLPEGE
ncbi:MAG: biopolymer transporter ExbD [Algisphaera sp.]